ncbi:MAG: class I SAM-dependent methyltransferase [Isosphaeraceae bacterium]
MVLSLSLAFLSLFLAWVGLVQAQSTTEKKNAPVQTSRPRKPVRSDPPGFYKGRRIADVMSFAGADWLIRETREEEEQPEKMLDALRIPKGATVADVGAGVGYTSLRLSRRVGPKGIVYATDVQPEMIEMLVHNAREAGVSNIKPLLCTVEDTRLPDSQVDLILMVDVYHECPDPVTTLKGMRKALKPGGRLVLVEFRAEDPEVPIKPEHKMTLAQARREVEPQGFTFRRSFEFLPWQHIIVFEKPAEAKEKERNGKDEKKDPAPSREGVRSNVPEDSQPPALGTP